MTPREQQPVASETDTTPEHRARPQVAERKKTWGEHIFDAFVYLGIAMGGNELLATKCIEKAKTSAPVGQAHPAYEWLRNSLNKIPFVKNREYVREGRLPFLLVAFIGGNLAAIPVLFAEFKKSPIVHWLNRRIYGTEATKTDPTLIEAQKEMDEAPPQTWKSITKGRIVTMATAVGLDWLMGYPKALSTKFVEKFWPDSAFNNYSSMDRASTTGIRKIADWWNPAGKQARIAAENTARPFSVQVGEGKLVNFLATISFLTSLSLVLTGIFYVSSKLFANKEELRKEAKRDALGQGKHGEKIFAADTAPEAAADTEKPTDQPATRIRDIALAERQHPREAMVGA